jgi:hypothetical protein
MGLWPIQGDEKRLGSATTLYGTVALSFVIPSVPGFPTSLNSTTYVVLPKENHMQLTEAATLDRKSGEADLSRRAVEGSAVPRTFRGNVFRQSAAEWRDLRFSLNPRTPFGRSFFSRAFQPLP